MYYKALWPEKCALFCVKHGFSEIIDISPKHSYTHIFKLFTLCFTFLFYTFFIFVTTILLCVTVQNFLNISPGGFHKKIPDHIIRNFMFILHLSGFH